MFGVRKCSNFILLQVVDQFSQHHLLKILSLIHCIFLPPLSKIRCPYVRGFISGLCLIPLLTCKFSLKIAIEPSTCLKCDSLYFLISLCLFFKIS